jgi:glucose-1-phosphate adenylyltransferase
VEHSVLSPGVFVDRGAVVRDSIVMMDSVVGVDSVIDRSILDKEVVVGADCFLGFGRDNRANRRYSKHLNTGITVVGKRAQIPSGARIGRNCLIGSDVRADDFPTDGELILSSGSTVEASASEKLVASR